MQDRMEKYARQIERVRQEYEDNAANGKCRQSKPAQRVRLRAGCDRRDGKRIVLYVALFIKRRVAAGR